MVPRAENIGSSFQAHIYFCAQASSAQPVVLANDSYSFWRCTLTFNSRLSALVHDLRARNIAMQ